LRRLADRLRVDRSGGKLATRSTFRSSTTTDERRGAMKQPRNPFHPGEILLEEFLRPGGMTQAALAGKLGWTKARLNELIRGKRGITADSALDLARVLRTTAKLWMNLQATYDLDQAAKKRKAA
jgi:addiction module HigA family antidote